MNPQTTTLAPWERIERLEEQNRAFKRCILALLVVFGVILLVGQARPKDRVTEAEKFVLKGANGKVLASLGAKDDEPVLVLYDLNGKERAGLSVSTRLEATREGKAATELHGGPSLWLTDENGEPRAGLTVDRHEPYLWLHNPNGSFGATLYVGAGGPKITLYDAHKRDKVIWSAP